MSRGAAVLVFGALLLLAVNVAGVAQTMLAANIVWGV